MKLLIAIPVYNERKYVGHVLDKIKSFHSDLLVIDDGSTDGTGEYLVGRSDLKLIRHPKNQGYGQSLIDAFAFAGREGYDWVITMDCDEQHEPEMLPTFIRHIEADDADIISGSRYMRVHDNDDAAPGDRRQINTFLTATINDLFEWSFTDTFCGYKAHRVAGNRLLQLSEPGYAFPMQLWPQVYNADLRVKEIPVRRIYNDPTRHFGGQLDNADSRLQHYLAVLRREVKHIGLDDSSEDSAVVSACCSE